MSVSTDSEPPYNEFYNKAEVSDGESEGFIDRTVVKQAPAKARAAAVQPTSGSLLEGLLAPFEVCCVIRSTSETNRANRPTGPAAGESSPLGEFIMQTSEVHEYSNDESSETSSEEGADVAIGAAPGIYKQSRKGRGVAGGGKAKTEELSVIKSRLESYNVKWRNLMSTGDLDDVARWTVSMPLSQSLDLGILELSNNQKRLLMLYWCTAVTLSEKMTLKLLQKCIEVARWEMPSDLTIDQALRKRDEFGTLVSE